MSRDAERIAALHGYTAMRRYVLDNRGRHKRAEMVVRVTSHEDGSRTFETVSASGWGVVLKHVFPRLLEAEVESSRPDARERSRITPENYSFETIGTEEVRGRPAYVMAIEPKREINFSCEAGFGWMLRTTRLSESRGNRRRILPFGSGVFISRTSIRKTECSGFLCGTTLLTTSGSLELPRCVSSTSITR